MDEEMMRNHDVLFVSDEVRDQLHFKEEEERKKWKGRERKSTVLSYRFGKQSWRMHLDRVALGSSEREKED
jgi:hypothetical protein